VGLTSLEKSAGADEDLIGYKFKTDEGYAVR
jgi:hypothetical protein